ncbi:Fur family transcriptional regulator [Pseudoramibacter sp.]|jgi:Fe2+ or Zn2+ uptake regulation protein|uniref:Fur family transcriptional regulator n=1 Tax=Pseudoramibacter sp. TaxID=2034862 RepID=UPI0025D06E49|nr:transcriptional repressor [Pseudoramibacter sp.]MCH4072939.1 transcriptional repressor [Pseudoramibacter sp.]MCH4106710.1 transcriptional repressor [Pseudoramibacter sp.]
MAEREYTHEEVARLIRRAGLRATFQRTALLQIILNSKRHPTAEMLMKKIKEQGIHLSMGTIYNTLECFEKHNLIIRVHDENDVMRYDGNTDFHIHLVDHSHIDDLFDCELEDIIRKKLADKLPSDMQSARIEVTLYK